jgi:hypothetical protein
MFGKKFETDGAIVGDLSVETTLLIFKTPKRNKNMLLSIKCCETQRIILHSGNIIQFSIREASNSYVNIKIIQRKYQNKSYKL